MKNTYLPELLCRAKLISGTEKPRQQNQDEAFLCYFLC